MASYSRSDWRVRTFLASLRAALRRFLAALTASASSPARAGGSDLRVLPVSSLTSILKSGVSLPVNSRSP